MTPEPIFPDSAAPVQPGDVLGGKFRVERVLGQGGMGVVVAATHLQLDERVALKFLLPTALVRPDVVARFAREARAAARIKSEHIARVSDVGTLPDGAPYMVMEYLEGQDLGTVLKSRGPLPVVEALDYVLQACEAIAEAHAIGIVHRDLKPANLFLARERDGTETVKVLDFGISKVSDSPEGHLTSSTTILGSPVYMSPEQMLASHRADTRSDIWSLGVVLHEMLTAQLPFMGSSMPEICSLILQGEPVDPRTLRPDLSFDLAEIIRRCLAKKPDDRFASVAELALALQPYAPTAGRSIQRILRRQSSADLSLSLSSRAPSVHDETPTLDGHQPAPTLHSPSSALALSAPGSGPLAGSVTTHPELSPAPPPRRWVSLGALALLLATLALVLHQRSTSMPVAASPTPASAAPLVPSALPAPADPAPALSAPLASASSPAARPTAAPPGHAAARPAPAAPSAWAPAAGHPTSTAAAPTAAPPAAKVPSHVSID